MMDGLWRSHGLIIFTASNGIHPTWTHTEDEMPGRGERELWLGSEKICGERYLMNSGQPSRIPLKWMYVSGYHVVEI